MPSPALERPLANTEIFDVAIRLHNSVSALTSTVNGTIDGSAQILDLGSGQINAQIVADVTAIDVSSTDENYDLLFQLSNTSDFSSGIVSVPAVSLGAVVANERTVASTVGRYIALVTNNVRGTLYRYARLRAKLSGTTPSITIPAVFLAKL